MSLFIFVIFLLLTASAHGQYNSSETSFQELLRNKRKVCNLSVYPKSNNLFSCQNKKRILLVTSFLPNPRIYEGPNRGVYHIIESLVVLGHEISLVTCQKFIPTSHDPIADHLMKLGVHISRFDPPIESNDASSGYLKSELDRFQADLLVVWLSTESYTDLVTTAVVARKISSTLKIVCFMNDAALVHGDKRESDLNDILKISNMVISNNYNKDRWVFFLKFLLLVRCEK